MRWPDLDAGQVLAAVEARWDLTGPFPIPRGTWLRCPVCGAGDPQPRYWRFWERSGTPTIRYRCDVSFKCVDCSALYPTFGVPLPDDYWHQHARKPGRQIWHREARKIMEG